MRDCQTIATFALLCLTAALMAGGVPAQVPQAERIVYASFASENWEIWSITPDGTQGRQLTTSPWDDRSPSVCPKSDRVVFANNRGELWTIRADGSQPEIVELPLGMHQEPCWTPDGRKIICSVRLRPTEEQADLHFISLTDKGAQSPKILLKMPGIENFPAVSPDGQSIAFSHFEVKQDEKVLPRKPVIEEIHVLDVPTGDVRQLTRFEANTTEPGFSPDGKTILCCSNREGTYDIWRIDTDGSNAVRLTEAPGYEGAPCWSPDGTRIAFASDRTGHLEIWTMAADGSDWKQLTRSLENRDSTAPSWGRIPSPEPER